MAFKKNNFDFRFSSPLRPDCVDYKRFSEVVEESFTQPCLERAPLIVPMQHIPTRDCERNFLNFEERLTLSLGLQKLSKKPDLKIDLMSIFKVSKMLCTIGFMQVGARCLLYLIYRLYTENGSNFIMHFKLNTL